MRRLIQLISLLCLGTAGCGWVGNSGNSKPFEQLGVRVNVTGPAAARLGDSALFTATVINGKTPDVVWHVNDAPGGNDTVGTISSSGIYTAPKVMPSGVIKITAISADNKSASGFVTASLWNPLPVLISAVTTQIGSTQNVMVNAIGTGFIPSSSLLINGSAVATTYVSPLQLQATIPVAQGTTKLTVSVSNPDPGSAISALFTATVSLAGLPPSGGSSNPPVSNPPTGGGTTTSITAAAAARLLDQATFGPTLSDIQHVQKIGFDAWLDEQFSAPVSTMPPIPISPLPDVCAAKGTGAVACAENSWWQAAINGPDQLRQRVAFALSQLFVVSTLSETGESIPGMHNALASNAFGNFRTLMHDVTLQPAMGDYLNMLNSGKPPAGAIANENFAREMLQLFTTGTYMLNQDGTLALDGHGNPVPVYTQAQIQAFARAYTGWTFGVSGGGPARTFPTTRNWYEPMASFDAQHDSNSKLLLNGQVLPAGQTAVQDLDGALDNIFQHANVGPFVCRQLIQHLVTSAPSPGYIKRVAIVFADNGSGIRGDLRAVVKAILLDPEARAGDTDPAVDGGHLREPLLFMTAMARAFGFKNKNAAGSYYALSSYTSALGQEPYRASSVFNFFPPDYVVPGTTLNAPEFGIENVATVVQRLTLADAIVKNAITDFTVDFSDSSSWGKLAANPDDLVDSLNVLLMHSQMPSAMRTTILNAITPLTSPAQRVRFAVFLIITSSPYKVIH